MRASQLVEGLPAARDGLGRLPVDTYMRVAGIPGLFAAGDVACAKIDGEHSSVMSCQHGRPMGRYAGHNVAADLLGAPLLPLNIDWYTTILDLGPCGAVYTRGWDRQVVATGQSPKRPSRRSIASAFIRHSPKGPMTFSRRLLQWCKRRHPSVRARVSASSEDLIASHARRRRHDLTGTRVRAVDDCHSVTLANRPPGPGHAGADGDYFWGCGYRRSRPRIPIGSRPPIPI